MKTSHRFGLNALILLVALPLWAAEGRRHLYQPATINEPGDYLVTRDISATSGSAITIASDGVRLDLGGRTLATNDLASPVISISPGQTDVQIRRGRLDGGANGILYSSTVVRTRLRIENVDISNPSDWGIYIFGAEYVEIAGCTIHDAGTWDGIYVHGVSGGFGGRLVDNSVDHVGRAGLYVYGMAGGEIRGNLASRYAQNESTGDGLFLSAGVGWDAGGNTIADNVFRDGTGSAAGIEINVDSPNNLLTGNVVLTNGGMGIRLASDGNRVRGNTSSANGSDGFSIGASRNVARRNRVTGNGGDGIRVQTSFNLLEANLIEGNGGLGINFDIPGNNAYRDNMLRGNTSGAVGGASNTDGGGNIN